jgi:hypothetical protein
LGVSVPQVDSKNEGAQPGPWELQASPKPIAMGPDSFCDGAIFEATTAQVTF